MYKIIAVKCFPFFYSHEEQDLPLVIAFSLDSVFDMSKENAILKNYGIDAYADYQKKHINDLFFPGSAYRFIQKINSFNKKAGHNFINIIFTYDKPSFAIDRLMNTVINSDIRFNGYVFSNELSPVSFLKELGTNLFLSANISHVKQAVDLNIPSARLFFKPNIEDSSFNPTDSLMFAFDGDAVLFSNESQLLYDLYGLKVFTENEREKISTLIPPGSFASVLSKIVQIKNEIGTNNNNLLQTALVTARSDEAFIRAIFTLKSWNLPMDNYLSTGRIKKVGILRKINTDIFFDDQLKNIFHAMKYILSGRVPF
jgi:5'-nucleotidase